MVFDDLFDDLLENFKDKAPETYLGLMSKFSSEKLDKKKDGVVDEPQETEKPNELLLEYIKKVDDHQKEVVRSFESLKYENQ